MKGQIHVLPKTTKEMRIHDLKLLIKERAVMVYVLESALMDNTPKLRGGYKLCVEDEILNHNLNIEEYKTELKKLTKK